MIRLPVILATFFLSVKLALAGTITVLALGDSLMAGYGLEAQQAFPVKLQAALRAEGLDVTIINAGVSGDTAAAGLARLQRWIERDERLAEHRVSVDLREADVISGFARFIVDVSRVNMIRAGALDSFVADCYAYIGLCPTIRHGSEQRCSGHERDNELVKMCYLLVHGFFKLKRQRIVDGNISRRKKGARNERRE